MIVDVRGFRQQVQSYVCCSKEAIEIGLFILELLGIEIDLEDGTSPFLNTKLYTEVIEEVIF